MLTKLIPAILLAIAMALPSALTLAQSHDTGNDIVTSFPWITDGLGNHQSKVEQAYSAGMLIQRLHDFFEDDSKTTLINRGAGPRQPSEQAIDLKNLPADTGQFGLFVAFEPADVALYKTLLPGNFTMPENPEVSLVIVDYNQSNPVVRYKEGMVMLKAVAPDGQDTWYVHSMPVEDWLMLAIGHDWGFRKELFDMTVTKTHASAHRRNGDLFFALELTDRHWNDNAAVVPARGAGGINNMAVVYPRNVDIALVFGSTGSVLVLEKEERIVGISIGKGLDWAGLVPESGEAPGYFQQFIYEAGDAYIKKLW